MDAAAKAQAEADAKAQAEAAAKPDAPPSKPKFSKGQVAGRIRQIKWLFEEGLLMDDFSERRIAECEAFRERPAAEVADPAETESTGRDRQGRRPSSDAARKANSSPTAERPCQERP